MKFKRRLSLEVGLTQIDFVPFMSVIMLFIIFFILTSQLLVTPGVTMRIPNLLSPEAIGTRTLLLTVNSRNEIFMGAVPSSITTLESLLNKGDYASVFIQADKNVSLDIVARIYKICQNKGIERIGVATTFER